MANELWLSAISSVSASAVVKTGAYRDSIELMRLTLEIEAVPGLQQASVMMGTPPNLKLLDEAGLLLDGASGAGPNDLIIAIRAETDAALLTASDTAESLLRSRDVARGLNVLIHLAFDFWRAFRVSRNCRPLRV